MKKVLFSIFILVSLSSCTKDRILPDAPNSPGGNDTNQVTIQAGYLFVNEYLATGNGFLNEFGQPADWIEIYNPQNFPVTLEAGKWFITDDASNNPEKYNLPVRTIPARGFLLVWCDNQHNNPNAQDVHASFALSSAGEHIGIFYKLNNNNIIQIDERQYGPQIANVSEGRSPDGATVWTSFNNPTPGASNP
ncbi:MAG: lamin tail domain-containing protein [Flavobacteriales bacterium]